MGNFKSFKIGAAGEIEGGGGRGEELFGGGRGGEVLVNLLGEESAVGKERVRISGDLPLSGRCNSIFYNSVFRGRRREFWM